MLHPLDKQLVDDRRGVDIVYLEFRKFFDAIPPKNLMEKLLVNELDEPTVRLAGNGLISSCLERGVVRRLSWTALQLVRRAPAGSAVAIMEQKRTTEESSKIAQG
ncbi:hypothetical protein BTVI_28718 [Pitangus sulphuratus]|nr:hypothetical protein BTVI_28718 [Pitangus sulphuratus]